MRIGPTTWSEGGEVVFKRYAQGGTAIVIWEDEEPVLTATVWLETPPADDDCVWVKDYSENEGTEDALVAAGVVTRTGRFQMSGFVAFMECRLTPAAIAERAKQLEG